jgi:hypothetical protein
MIRLAIGVATAALLLSAVVGLLHDHDATASPREMFVVSLGDRIQLDAAPVGCRVARLAGHGQRPYVECRRGGALEGTYGAFFSGRDVMIARFLGSREARIVFRATHEGSVGSCR